MVVAWMCVSSTAGISQEGNSVFLNNQTVFSATSESKSLQTTWPTNNCGGDNGCYAIIQLTEIPTAADKVALAEIGIQLLAYIPNRAYLAAYTGASPVILPDFVEQVLPISPNNKRPDGPLLPTDDGESGSTIALVGLPFPGITPVQLAQILETYGATIRQVTSTTVVYDIPGDNLTNTLTCPLLQYTEAVPLRPVPEGMRGRSNTRLRASNQGPGTGYDGTGVTLAIGDDGRVNHLDFHGRLTDHCTYNTGNHGEMTSGMAAGAGNIKAATAGSGAGVNLHLFDLGDYEYLNNAPANFAQYGIVITSTSYADGCGDSYELATQGLDNQVYNNPQLLHCFSAGNHGADPCYNPYSWLGPNAQGIYYATITGGRKSAKNVLAVGNNDWNDQLLPSSSRGPTPDGRIKPDLSALGQGDQTTGPNDTYRPSSGTSAAAPNVAGGLAGLYQYYKAFHGGQQPSSALIKAVALNTADDLGPAGPDYHYGWGRFNAGKALRTLESGHFFNGSITHGQQQSFQLAVPAGALRLKVMIYWHDPAGSVLSSKALVNDLDLKVQRPNGQELRPWLPSSFPNLDSLGRAALPGIDRINNMEQVVVDNPTSGFYNLLVKGFQVPSGPQEFYIVYDFELAPMSLATLAPGTTFVPGEEAVLAWDAINNGLPFAIDFSNDGGQAWQTLSNTIPANQNSFLWNVPATSGSMVKFRLRRGNQTVVSEGTAVIAALPVFAVSYENPTTARLSWEPISGAVGYRIYLLGARYMEVVGTSSSLNFALPATVGGEYWLSVAPVFPNGQVGRRADAKKYEHFGCENSLRLALQFDRYPAETAWAVLDATGSVRLAGGPYTNAAAFSYLEESICLPPGCYTLYFSDAYNDGMCCNNGDGWYRLTDTYGNALANGGSFGSYAYHLFCVDPDPQPALSLAIAINSPISCAGAATGALTANATGGAGNFTYQWSNGATTALIQDVPADTYTVTVNDGGQSTSATVSLVAPPAITISYAAQAAYCTNGSISLGINGGTPPYAINWADGAATAARTGLAPGNYYAVVTDANGCLETATIPVVAGAPLNIQLTGEQPSCAQGNSGSISALVTGGATSNYLYQWSTGAQQTSVLYNLGSGTYALTVTNGDCQASQSLTLAGPTSIAVNATFTHPTCAGAHDGAIALNTQGGTPPFAYQWSDGGSTTSERTNLPAGVYLVTVTDARGCSAVRGIPLTSPAALSLSVEITPQTPLQGGSISLQVAGGVAPYQINWSNGAQGPDIAGLEAGRYTVVVTDANGCMATTLATVNQEGSNNPDVFYCPTRGANTNYEWIAAITHNGNNYASGNDNGYGDYTAISLPMVLGAEQILDLIPGYRSTPYRENWVVWIDFNKDGDFADAGETVASAGPLAGTTSVGFMAPATAPSRYTRMRIAMQYGSLPLDCVNPNYGEVEEYTIEWIDANTTGESSESLRLALPATAPALAEKWLVFPNPARDQVVLEGLAPDEEWLQIQLLDSQGRMVYQGQEWSAGGQFRTTLDVQSLPSGLYLVIANGQDWSQQVRLVKR